MASNFVKLCTAALAGSLIGIAYERLPPASDWPSLMQTVSAAGSIVPRNGKSLENNLDQAAKKDLPEVDGIVAAENFKHSGRFGLPSGDNLRLFNDYLLSYDRRLRAPAWVFEHLTPEKLSNPGASDRSKSKFREDDLIHDYFRAKNSDFAKSGFDRGHMAAAGNHKLHQDHLDQTFALSNISPQRPKFNQGGWERLETYVRWRAKRAKNLYVVTGPLYLPMKARDGNLYVTYQVLGNNHVSVPTHYFKVFLVETNDNRLELEAFVMPNDDRITDEIRLDDYRVGIDRLDTIERASGVLFFSQIDKRTIVAPDRIASNFKEGPRGKLAPRGQDKA